MKLVGAYRADLIGLYVDPLLLRFQPRVRQIDHQPRRVGDRLDRRDQRLRRKNFDCRAILLLHDPETLDRGTLLHGARGAYDGRSGRVGVGLDRGLNCCLGAKPRRYGDERSHRDHRAQIGPQTPARQRLPGRTIRREVFHSSARVLRQPYHSRVPEKSAHYYESARNSYSSMTAATAILLAGFSPSTSPTPSFPPAPRAFAMSA